MSAYQSNPLGLCGISFVEFASPDPERLDRLFRDFGFTLTLRHPQLEVDLYQQNDINLLINRKKNSDAGRFSDAHGPCIASMGWRFVDPTSALEMVKGRGARVRTPGRDFAVRGKDVPAIYGIGDSLIYFTNSVIDWSAWGFESIAASGPGKGFLSIDHLTNNVPFGALQTWGDFYKTVFGFREVRYFDIRGVKTGLQSYALRSPCGSFCIPINEAREENSQINEYLREYRGPGIQHLAFLTDDIVASLEALRDSSISTLDIDESYYRDIFTRVPNVSENHDTLQRHKILVDGDEKGYLLQIFTKNLIGPIFVEIIQRKNHLSFGEGNFGALFRSIERDQEKRGVLG